MPGTPEQHDYRDFVRGDFVRATDGLGVGRLTRADGATATIRYFKGPMRQPFVDIEYPRGEVTSARLALNTRVFFLQEGHWRVGRVDAIPAGRGEEIVVALPNSDGALLSPDRLEVRWRRPIDDPFAFLMSGGTESPMLSDTRVAFLAGWMAQRAASHGAEGLVLSSVELHAHQVAAVRRVTADPVRRYLLADEVGLGKTIEAGALVRQSIAEGAKRVLVLVPDHLCGQWAAELAGRFHLDVDGDQVHIQGHHRVLDWPAEPPDLLVIDEAHHMTRTGGFPPEVRRRVHALAIAARSLLLLTATPVRSNEAGFLDLLSMLDPDQYRSDDLDEFVRRVDSRDELALIHRSLESVEDLLEFSYLSDQLRELFPRDEVLGELIDAAVTTGESGLAAAAYRIRSHLSEVYRLHHRMIRTRRSPELTRVFGVRGRRRGRPFTAEVTDQTDSLRLELLEFLRSRLAAALDEGLLSESATTAIFRECAARCGSLPVALEALTGDLEQLCPEFANSDAWLHDSDRSRIVALAGRIVNSWTGFESGFVEALSSLVASRPVGRVVLASAFSESSTAAFDAMQVRWGAHRVALHSVTNTPEANDASIERWRTDPSCTLLFCDAGAEEGVNLQAADVLVHLDLPWQTPRLEQRLGRCDRFREGASDPIASIVLMYGDQPFASSWFEFVADSTHVFDESASSLQYVLADVEEELLDLAVHGGPIAMVASTSGFEARLSQERVRIAAQDSLDAVSTPSVDRALMDSDSDRSFGSALTLWLEGVACGVQHVRAGVIQLRPRGRVHVPFEVEVSITRCLKTQLALSREAAVSGKVEVLRAGHPLVDAIAVHLNESDRGVAFAMLRHATGVWPPSVVARADVSSSVDRSAVLDVRGLPPELRQRVLDLCVGLLPSGLESVWFFPNGDEVTHPSVLRAYSRESGDINLGSRPEAFEALTSHLDWESLCSRGTDVARGIAQTRLTENSDRAHRVELLIARIMTEVDQRRTRSAAGLSGDEWVLDGDTIERLRRVLMEPRSTVIGAGVVFLADRQLAGLE